MREKYNKGVQEMKNVIVCGSRFGQFYIEALKGIDGMNIVGLLAKGSKRSHACAAYYKLPMYKSIEEIPKNIDLACIAVKTGALGGQGTLLAEQFLKKKINVLLEQPVHYKELGECYKIARTNDVYFGIGNLYLNLPAVRNFIENVQILSRKEQILYINIDLATQVSYPIVSILGEVLSTLRPWEKIGIIKDKIPFQTDTVKINDIPVTFRAHNEIDKYDIDGFLHLLFQITVGFPSGRLSLCDPHGPVMWNPRIHFPKAEIIPGVLNDMPPQNMKEANCLLLFNGSDKVNKNIFTDVWPCAIRGDITKAVKHTRHDEKSHIQKNLINSQAWQLLMKDFGYPEIVHKSEYSYFPAKDLLTDSEDCFEIRNSLVEGMADFNRICLKTMYFYLQYNLSDRSRGYTYEELIERMQIKKDYYAIICRWIKSLCINNYIRGEGVKLYFDSEMSYAELEHIWKMGKNSWKRCRLGKDTTYQYFEKNALQLQEIMKGQINPTLLLFPEGQMYIADDLYSGTPISIYYNKIISDYIRAYCETNRKCKILELGGGTAATTKGVIEALQDCDVEKYTFSDISDFFLNHARKIFHEIPYMDYLRLDIDSDFDEEAHLEDSIDIVLAVGVLNNARDIELTLKCIRRSLKENGRAIIVEAIGESVQMLISQAFMMEAAIDERAQQNNTFLSLEQWYTLFQKAGFTVTECLPAIDSELTVYNQKIFILNC